MARLDRANKAGMNRLPQHAQAVTISSPVGTVTTFQFNPSGTIEDWTVPFHDGPMEVLCIGGAGSRQGPVPNGSGGRRDHASPVAVNQAGGS